MPPKNGLPVPGGRLARLARFGGLATGIAGGVLAGGVRQLASGRRPQLGDLLMTPANALRVTQQLSHLRGAAMKLGQLVSMDAGDMLPPELAEILGRLRSDAQPMPERQLHAVLARRWGADWRARFTAFSPRPVAAASIGQVHRARTLDGRDLAIKIQYPGIAGSIDSDVANVAGLLRLSGLLPARLDIAPLLAEARRQLHEEADYAREGRCLAQFGMLLADAPDFMVPGFHAELSGPDILAMDWADGIPIEATPADARDRVATLLIDLTLRELFAFGTMQTDPNFANYRYDPASGRIVLLDFGATRAISPEVAAGYHMLFGAVIANDAAAVRNAAAAMGLFGPDAIRRHGPAITAMIGTALALFHAPGPFDFGDAAAVARLRDAGMGIATDRESWHVPPPEMLFPQRKFGGVYLLASRLKARVDVQGLLARAL